MGKKILAGVLGGLAFFAWSTIAHLALGLGEVGISEIPNEQTVVSGMKGNIPASGMYIFPGWGLGPNATHSQKMAAMNVLAPKIKAGPTGLLIFHPQGSDPLSPKQMLTELGTNMLQAFIVVLLLAQTGLASFGARWRFATLAGVVAAISTNMSYWNWYGFPGNYTVAYICTIAMGFVCAGAVAAAMIKPAAGQRMAARA
ncbi:MAG TPA: hypothetical protein VJN64_05385 [Terriglobales bacterium]|nr:hypothetical protein [Terriglobales bacterium]